MTEMQTEMNLDDALEANKIEQAKLLEQIKVRDAERRTAALVPVLAAIREHAFTAAELGFAPFSKKSDVPTPKAERTTIEPKYKDPESGATWAGRGKIPAWMSRKIEGGKSKEDFLIVKPSAPAESGEPAGAGELPAGVQPGASGKTENQEFGLAA